MFIIKNAHGFHLIEMMIVCSILAIFLSFAWPRYTAYQVESKRFEAQLMLFKYASAMERFYFLKQTYTGASPTILRLPSMTPHDQYEIHIESSSDHEFVLKARPLNAQAKRDRACGVLTLNQLGERNATGTLPADKCWRA